MKARAIAARIAGTRRERAWSFVLTIYYHRPHTRKRRRVDAEKDASPRPVEDKKAKSLTHGDGPDTPAQQASYLGRSDYLTAHLDIDEDDATHYNGPGLRAGAFQHFEARIRRNVSSLEIPRGTLRQSLLRNFLHWCRPWMPLVSETDLERLDARNQDTLLVTATLVAGSIVSSAPEAADHGRRCYQRAKVLFYTNGEQNHLHTIMAILFLQWLNPSGPEHVSIDNSSFWLRTSVALAHQIGLHREPDPRMAEARLRRRIWWALVSRDNLIATSHGRPRAINAEDSNVRPLRVDDFEAGDNDALLFMQFVQITSILGDMTEHYRRGTLSDRKKIDFEDSLRAWLNAVPSSLRLYRRGTETEAAAETKKGNNRLTEYDFKFRQLHVLYFTALIILFRHDNKNDPPAPVSLLAASFISGIFEEYLTHEDIPHLPVTAIFYLMVAALLQLSYQRFPSLAAHRNEEIDIIRLSLDGLKKRFPSAIGAERVVNQMMNNHSTSVQDTAESTRMNLTPEEAEFFAPFGPELCRQWGSIFGPRPAGPSAMTTDVAGVGRHSVDPRAHATADANGVLATAAGQGHHHHTEHHVIGTTSTTTTGDVAGRSDAPWDVGGTLLLSQDEDTLFSSEQTLDTVGRWWWADWVPEADLDFLSKSL
ncbi:hypothetical protein G647_09511 [Cladophialophora carrionii CBS 160.54]|uniref:Xylanolytic transcriptional activator regulatory domain-containing protein n=1 Tax=Cladophialophora carrionii CBS 160.54 TaxID=1279043 RepID=V9DKT1_9EURO|nr:uncharacterized protein G647_09511 [Cladophialophora carrionii CBS 160.54]ETI27321.1 hypothetical protein G647_09511 [Cladophialophora carrionii CBS 160.54]